MLASIKRVYRLQLETKEQEGVQNSTNTCTYSTESIFNALVEAEKNSLLQEGNSYKPTRHRTVLPKWPLENSKELTELKEHWSPDTGGKVALLQKYINFEKNECPEVNFNVDFLKELLNTTKLARYVDHLTGKWHQTPSTVVKNIDAIRKALVWYQTTKVDVGYESDGSLPDSTLETNHKIFHRCLQALHVLKEMHKMWQRIDSKTVRRCNTIGAIILGNQWPTDDQVQNLIKLNVEKYNAVLSLVQSKKSEGHHNDDLIDSTHWRWIVSFIANTLNIHVCFGRPSLFQGLTCSMGRTALSGGITASSAFKTAHKWLIHGLVFEGGFVIKMLRDWMDTWRPIRAHGVESGQDLLFINFEGERVYDWSRFLSILWQDTYDMQMTCTTLRYWKATKMALSATTKEDRELVTHADCHGVQVTKKYYEKVFSLMDAYKAKAVTDSVCGLQMPESDESQSPSLHSSPSDQIDPPTAPVVRRTRKKRGGPWNQHDDNVLLEAYQNHGTQWVKIRNLIQPLL